jgi:hypothetical protein
MSRAREQDRRAPARNRPRRRVVVVIGVAALLIGVVVPAVISRAPAGGRRVVAASYTTTASGSLRAAAKPLAAAYQPARLRPLVAHPPAHDGVWRRVDRWSGSPPVVLLTTLRFDSSVASHEVYIAWIRTSRVQVGLYPGTANPSGPSTNGRDRGATMVPLAGRRRLLVTFNSGFYTNGRAGGFYTHGVLYQPMTRGAATIVQYRDGRIDVIAWSGGAHPDASIVMARQNLLLLVRNGRPYRGLATSSSWGATLGGVPGVWRTGAGVDAHGNLLYVAAPDQTAQSLARLLVRAGAVRAMELDINPEWPVLIHYDARGARRAALDLPNPMQTPQRFLTPSLKDFFAVYLRPAASMPPLPW